MRECNVIIKDKINTIEWDKLLDQSNETTFFSSYHYMDLNNDKKVYFELRSKSDKLIGGIIARVRGDFPIIENVARSLWVESAICLDNDVLEQGRYKLYLLEVLIKYAVSNHFCQVVFNHWSRETLDFTTFDSRINSQKTATFLIDLSLSEDKIFSGFSKGHKSSIKKAIKVENISIFVDEKLKYLNEYYFLYKQTQQRAIKADKKSSMTLHSKEYLERLLRLDGASLHLALLNNEVVSGAIIVENTNCAIYYLGASDIDLNRKYSSSNLLQWEIIKWAKNKGIRFYDFGGSPVNPSDTHPAFGVYRFKKSFGGEYKEYNAPIIIISKVKYWIVTNVIDNRKILRLIKKVLKY